MLRDEIAPPLRELGFVGSGQVYRLPDDRHWALLGFQRSTGSTWELLRFTVNLSVVPKELWEQRRSAGRLPPRPAPSTYYGPWTWWSRIGKLLPDGGDHWWDVGPAPDPAVASDVLAGVRDFALPALERRLGRR
ncbi:DUF4304 domain-containing protein [Planomonospora venezuelensis]|uniref:DUF4304 domain-containing protein n=1 Tax=Planomonospora venezuelensis TaxID=1999 RepID=A0A841CXU0_PLAVE|nr:DUF4304 domain-containing protein [Planomonospora venezuelensis]MBB5960938.1 hypothetical protein [Planomonospora venezuelensis]GIN01172.1 hypothetical protein Pve01_28300 [Planomonospora venezuelensis]